MKFSSLVILALLSWNSAVASEEIKTPIVDVDGISVPDEYLDVSDVNEIDPYREMAEAGQTIESLLDRTLWQLTGMGCVRKECPVFAYVNKSNQTLTLYVNGVAEARWPVSTGVPGRGTPNFNQHPEGPAYTYHTSSEYPGGDYIDKTGRHLGNMPYAVTIEGKFAIHGTPRGNWRVLGRQASHGCVRLLPDNALTYNSLVKTYGLSNTWNTVDNGEFAR